MTSEIHCELLEINLYKSSSDPRNKKEAAILIANTIKILSFNGRPRSTSFLYMTCGQKGRLYNKSKSQFVIFTLAAHNNSKWYDSHYYTIYRIYLQSFVIYDRHL